MITCLEKRSLLRVSAILGALAIWTTMLEAVHDQLGLTLKPTRAVVPVLVIDKAERPSEN